MCVSSSRLLELSWDKGYITSEMKHMRLGVNIDHIATLRQVRHAEYPSILKAAEAARRGGADQITIHLREDRRHIQDHDLKDLVRWGRLPINLEMGLTSEMIQIAARFRPESVTLVPERRAEMTTESGLNLKSIRKRRQSLQRISKLSSLYAFIDPDPTQVEWAAALGFSGVEFHTGPFANTFVRSRSTSGGRAFRWECQRLKEGASLASASYLEVKAGHGLTLDNLRFLKNMRGLEELNIGHSIVARSVFVGLEVAVREMKVEMSRVFSSKK